MVYYLFKFVSTLYLFSPALFILLYLFTFKKNDKLLSRTVLALILILLICWSALLFSAISCHPGFTYIARNFPDTLPLFLRPSVLWAGREGSLLTWNIMSLAFFLIYLKKEKKAGSPALLSYITVLFFLHIQSVFFSNPLSVNLSLHTISLNPLLQNGWMAIHPPLVFASYAAALCLFFIFFQRDDRLLSSKLSFLKVLFLIQFFLLSLGIISGGIWAYSTLGWGGFWSWDPVETSVYIPWLFSVTALHELYRKKISSYNLKHLRTYSSLISVSAFIAVFITRSGIATEFSVHSFAPSKSAYLYFVIALVLAGLMVYRKSNKAINTIKGTDRSSLHESWARISMVTYTLLICALLYIPMIINLFLRLPLLVDTRLYSIISIFFVLILTIAFIKRAAAFLQKRTLIVNSAAAFVITLFISIISSFSIIYFMPLFILFLALFLCGTLPSKRVAAIHGGALLFVIGAIIAFNSTVSRTVPLESTKEYKIEGEIIHFTGKQENLLKMKINKKEADFEQSSSFFTSPLILARPFYDLYISPVKYLSPETLAGTGWYSEGDKLTFGKKILILKNIDSYHNTVTFKGVEEYTLSLGKESSIEGVSSLLEHIDIQKKQVMIWIEPDFSLTGVPETLIVDVSRKNMMILFRLGLVFFSGGILALLLSEIKGRLT
jgi:cytochrome c-type biogenesis protein CcmF